MYVIELQQKIDVPAVYFPLKYWGIVRLPDKVGLSEDESIIVDKIYKFAHEVAANSSSDVNINYKGDHSLNNRNILIGIDRAGNILIEDL